MSEGTITASYGEHSKNVEDLVRALPSWMPSDPDSGNFDLLDVVGRAFDRLDEDIRDTDKAATLQDAQSVEEVEKLAYPVGVTPKTDEPLEKYRARVLGEFQALSSEGTINDLIRNTAILLGIPPDNVQYEQTLAGVNTLKVPLTAADSLPLTDSEFASVIGMQSAAGYSMIIQKLGTLTYLSEADYHGGDSYDPATLPGDPSIGYDGLDANGDPKGDGGTYSGAL